MRLVRNPLFRFILAIISLMVCVGLLRSIVSHLRRNDVVEEHRQSLVKEEERNRELKDRLKEATSPAFIEKQAREKLGLAKPGDTIVLMNTGAVVDAKSKHEAAAVGTSNWKRWWQLFF